ncbi:unnamed protein product [Dibothriocephalus latus]|uniref:Lipocalin/cytosolic fatty-acid binding domain-containing protein n=1 Tax=Dibothriocephalus latus TaxID=60516 RepID=A0A3P7NEI9_DIBLA|nr:unnamed protein product [Dibothriocephalus latus]
MEKFLGSWVLEKNENFVEYLSCLGVPRMVTWMVNRLPVTVNVCQEADEYTIENVTTLKKTNARFKLGEPFEETSMGDTTFKFS